ncbi:vacuolar ATP synthase subunit G [Heterostelium album PN500]|uniref:V-type proton ATPase subunit G n=1 Tax=Heterostelium pallidum (strain ATCC 26659 / Pp 5 / PN500) TaxID=670386 RepID=D3BCT7_HETP5|nr:vacuolar ATP synthase subunit G [Heterostelium album PN500]EFA80729.1 vacuolar ATP synthase subunit G [Heterostelium album PN500]|eukprot:XP_020432849.1 vacuolar ATP synthase subunit G [Heterostelium album PN500]
MTMTITTTTISEDIDMSEDGIKKLLEAERMAQETIARARQERNQKLKQAVQEAEKDIKTFKDSKEKEFKDYESKFLGQSSATSADLASSVNKEIEQIRKKTAQNKDEVVEMLLKFTTEVHVE